MIQVAPNVLVGTISEIEAHPLWAFINLTNNYHYKFHEWTRTDGKNHQADPCYLICDENPLLLSINWVDSPDPKYFDYNGQGTAIIQRIFDFIDNEKKKHPVGIVCNKAESRAPSVAMAYLAKRTDVLSRPVIEAADLMAGKDPGELINEAKHFEKPPYGIAREKFERIYSKYYPSAGITTFLIDHWDELL